MSSASSASSIESFTPWWLVLIEGILAIIIGAYLLIAPYRTLMYLVYFLGWYWLITGILTVALIFFNRSMWGWKLFSGIIGILAGAIIIYYPIASTFTILPVSIYIAAFLGILYGIIFLFQAFRGAGWGVGILGVLSIIFGFILLGNTLVAAATLPLVLGWLGILFGFLAIVMAFVVRGREKQEAEMIRRRAAVTVIPPRPAPPRTPPISAPAAVTPAAVKDVAGAGAGAASSAGVWAGSAAMAAAAGGVAGAVAAGAVASQAAAQGPAEVETPAEVVVPAEAEPVIAEAATVVAAVAPAPEEPPAVETPADAAEVEKNVEASVDRDNPEEMAKFSYPLEYVEGIGPVYAGKLKEIGIVTPLDLLKGGAFPKGRAEIAEKSGISGKLILEWVNHCDLYRIKGIGSEWADLLEEAGVDTVVELSMRNPKNLFDKMNLVNEEKKLVRKTPAQAQVEDWVGQAKQLPRVVNY